MTMSSGCILWMIRHRNKKRIGDSMDLKRALQRIEEMDPNKTIPPVGARTPRNMLRWLKAWAVARPDRAIAVALIVAAFVLGRCSA